MSFATDPAVRRLADALGCEAREARRLVRSLVDDAPAAAPWHDGRDLAVTTGFAGAGDVLLEALRRARLVVGDEGEIDLDPVAGERLGLLLAEERAMAAAKKARQRGAGPNCEMEQFGTRGGQTGDTRGTDGGPAGDGAATFGGHGGPAAERLEGPGGTFAGGPGLAFPNTRAGAARGYLTPPTCPPTETVTGPSNAPGNEPDEETYRLATSLRRRIAASISAPRGLDQDIAADLASGRITGPELLEAAAQARRKGGRSYEWLLAVIDGNRERMAAAVDDDDDGARSPPPMPLGVYRFIRKHEAAPRGPGEGE